MVKKQSYVIWIQITLCIKTDDIYEDIPGNLKARFDTSNYELDTPLSEGKNKNVIRLMKGKLGLKIMANFVWLRAETYSCIIDDSSKNERAKGTKKGVIKRKRKFENYKNCSEVTQPDKGISYSEKWNYCRLKFFEKDHKEFIKNHKLTLNHSKDLKVKGIMYYWRNYSDCFKFRW